MNSKERVTAVLEGGKPDRTPVAFWCHFPTKEHHGEGAVKAHLKFFQESRTDICKIMNENTLPCTYKIDTVHDFAKAAAINMKCAYMKEQVEQVKRIVDAVEGKAVVLATIHGVIVSAHHMSGNKGTYVENRHRFREYLEEDADIFKSAMERIAEGLAGLAEACIEAGADGIYYAALGAEKDVFTADEYEQYVAPLEKMVFEAAGKGEKYNTLHICKHKVDISRFQTYPASIINWAIHKDNPSLEDGMELFPDKAILGGLDDREGVLVEGSCDEIQREVERLIQATSGRKFILGTDCTLPTDYSAERLGFAVEACKNYSGQNNRRKIL